MLQHAALAHAGRILRADEVQRDRSLDRLVEIHAQEVDVHHVAAHWMALGVLEHGGGRGLAVAQLDDRAGRVQREAQLAGVDGEGLRRLTQPVEDAGDTARAAQAANRTRMRRIARFDGERCPSRLLGSHGGRAG